MKLCQKCSSRLEYLSHATDCDPDGVLCPWNAVTQTYDPLMDDPLTYEIILKPGNEISKQSLKAVSKVAGMGYIEAKRLIEGQTTKIFAGFADEIMTKKPPLDEAGVEYVIVPDYPYQ